MASIVETITRIALIEKSVDYVKERCHGEFVKLSDNPGWPGQYKKYAFYDEKISSLFLILKSKTGKLRRYDMLYDFIFTVTSEGGRNKEILKTFYREAKITFKEPLQILEDKMQNLNFVFNDFKKAKSDEEKKKAMGNLCSMLYTLRL